MPAVCGLGSDCNDDMGDIPVSGEHLADEVVLFNALEEPWLVFIIFPFQVEGSGIGDLVAVFINDAQIGESPESQFEVAQDFSQVFVIDQ